MSRQTYREPSGRWGVKGISWPEIPDRLYGALYKLMDYEDVCDSPRRVASYMDSDLGPVRYQLIDEAHNVWQCPECGHIEQFEANGPISNGWSVCPCCARMIADDSEAVLDEEDDDEPA